MGNGPNVETRRKSPRVTITAGEIVYLNFQSGNGAIVLDVSAEGFGFQSADPLAPNDSVSLLLSTPGAPDIVLGGQVAWLDATRKRGGMRLNVSADARPAFRQWQRKYLASLPEIEEKVPTSRNPASVPTLHADDHTARPPAEALPAAPLTTSAAVTSSSALGSRGSIFVSHWDPPPEKSHTARNWLLGCAVLLIGIVVVGSYYWGDRRQLGALVIRFGQWIGGQDVPLPAQSPASPNPASPPQSAQPAIATRASVPGPQSPDTSMHNFPKNGSSLASPELAQPQPAGSLPSHQAAGGPTSAAPAPSNSAQSSSSNAARVGAARSAPNATPSVAARRARAAKPLSHARASNIDTKGARRERQVTSALTPGDAQVQQARKYLRGSNPHDAAVAASLLWSAIQAGNTQAELILGELYLRGQGNVPRNCPQAQALLTAAQSANVPGAAERFQELATYGCR